MKPFPHTTCRKPGFGFLPNDLDDYDSARVVVIPIPFEKHTTGLSGTADAPEAIIQASDIIETFDEQRGLELGTLGIATFDALDVHGVESEVALDRCRQAVAAVVRDGKFPMSLGGEHTITAGCVQGLTEALGQKVTLVQIDAHSDLRSSYLDTPYSHACAMRLSLPYVERLVQVGIRAICEEEWEFVAQNKGLISRHVAGTEPFEAVLEDLASIRGPVYLTVDMDGLDPSLVPGVGTPEPGGLSWQQMESVVRTLCRNAQLVGADINELMPISGQRHSEVIAAKLLWRILSYRFYPETRHS